MNTNPNNTIVTPVSPYQKTQNLFYTSQKQETELTKLQIVGEIPKWIRGKLIRNGPAIFEVGNTKLRHWFDGYGMLHGFIVENGEIYYHSKYIFSEEYLSAKSTGKLSTILWGTTSDPCRSIFRRFFANFTNFPSNTNVNIVKIGERYFTTSDIATINETDIDSLDTLSSKTTDKRGVMAAHPSFQKGGSIWNMISSLGPRPTNRTISFSNEVEVISHASFATPKTYYFHSFGNTERYFVSIEQPMYLSFKRLMLSGVKNLSFYECYMWDEKAFDILHIFDRDSKQMIHIATKEKFFFFHTINTFEQDSLLYIDFCGYENNSVIDDFYFDVIQTAGLSEKNKARVMRLTVNLKTKEVVLRDMKINLELPAINRTLAGSPYQFSYGIHSSNGSTELSDSIIKYDVINNTQIIWKENSLIPGEPVFVKTPNNVAEDDGVLMVVCYDKEKATSCLAILNAKTMQEMARADTPLHIPASFHGAFYKTK